MVCLPLSSLSPLFSLNRAYRPPSPVFQPTFPCLPGRPGPFRPAAGRARTGKRARGLRWSGPGFLPCLEGRAQNVPGFTRPRQAGPGGPFGPLYSSLSAVRLLLWFRGYSLCNYLHTLNVMGLAQLLNLYICIPNPVRVSLQLHH